MAEMQRFLADLTELVDTVTAGGSGPVALRRLVELAQQGADGTGAVFVEYGAEGGRPVAATGAGTSPLGRELDPRCVVELLAEGGPIESAMDDLPAALRAPSEACRVLGVRVEVAGRLVGSLHVYLVAGTSATPLQRSAFSLVAAVAAQLYQNRLGLARPDDVLVETQPLVPAPQAEAQQQAWDLLAAVTSHELRTPVTVIKGYADTLTDHWDALDESARRDVAQRLRQRSGDLARLVERLLAAVGDGTMPAGESINAPFELDEALRATVAELRDPVRLRLPDALPMALGERAGIATVLSELVTNAVKYSPAGQEVEVTGLFDAATVGFRVADRGIGIPAEHVERAFDRFWQARTANQAGRAAGTANQAGTAETADTAGQRRYGGIGLGLYLVRQIVGRQKGWVILRPRERGGTVAEVRLRRADA